MSNIQEFFNIITHESLFDYQAPDASASIENLAQEVLKDLPDVKSTDIPEMFGKSIQNSNDLSTEIKSKILSTYQQNILGLPKSESEFTGAMLDALIEIDEEDRESVAKASKQLITDEMDRDTISDILCFISKTKEDQRESVASAAKVLMPKKYEFTIFREIFRLLKKIPSDERQSVALAAKEFITESATQIDCRSMINALKKVDKDQRQSIVSIAKKIVSKKSMTISVIITTLKVIAKTSSDKRDNLVLLGNKYIKDSIPNSKKKEMIEAFSNVSKEDLQSYIDATDELITDSSSDEFIATVTIFMSQLGKGSLTGFASAAKELIQESMSEEEIKAIIFALGYVSKDNRNSFISAVKSLVPDNVSKTDLVTIMYSLSVLTEKEHENRVLTVNEFTSLVKDPKVRTSIVKALLGASQLQLKSLTSNAKKTIHELFPKIESGAEVLSVLETVKNRSEEEVDSLITITKKVMTEPRNNLQVSSFFEALANISEDQRESVANAAGKLINKLTNDSTIHDMVQTLVGVDKDERESVASAAGELIQKPVDKSNMTSMIQVLASLEKDERASVVSNVKELITKSTGNFTIIKMIITLSIQEKSERESLAFEVKEFMTQAVGDIDIVGTLDALTPIEKEKRKTVLEAVKVITQKTEYLSHIPSFIKALSLINPELLGQAAEAIASHDEIIADYDPDIIRFLLQNSRKINENFESYLRSSLTKVQEIELKALLLCETILVLVDEGIVSENSQLYLDSVAVKLMHDPTERENPKNPIVLFHALSESAKTPIESSQIRTDFNLKQLQETGRLKVYTMSDLEKFDVNSQTLMKLFSDAKTHIEGLSEKEQQATYMYIANVYRDMDREELEKEIENEENHILLGKKVLEDLEQNLTNKKGSTLMLNYTRMLKSSPDKPISSYHFKTFAILDDIQNTDDPSLRLEKLLGLSQQVRNCSTGQQGGIDNIFRGLGMEEITFIHPTLPVLNKFVRFLMNQLTEQVLMDITFLESLGGRESENVHQTRYLKNKLSPHIGFPNVLAFDPHTIVIPSGLFNKSLEELLEAFFKEFSLDSLEKVFLRHIASIKSLQVQIETVEREIKDLEAKHTPQSIKDLQKTVRELQTKFRLDRSAETFRDFQAKQRELQKLKMDNPLPAEVSAKRKQLDSMNKDLNALTVQLASDELKAIFGEPTFDGGVYAYRLNGEVAIEVDDLLVPVEIKPKAVKHILKQLDYV